MAHDPKTHPDPWNTDAWSAGVDSWWNAMSASRQMLQELGDQVQSAVSTGTSQVRLDDLHQVVAALGLVEERLTASAEQGAALSDRIDRIEVGLQGLTEQVALVARTVSALGRHVEVLAAAAAPPEAPTAGKAAAPKAAPKRRAPARKPRSKSE